jgi:hypothetical protein
VPAPASVGGAAEPVAAPPPTPDPARARRRLLVGAGALVAVAAIAAAVLLTRKGDTFPAKAEKPVVAAVPAGYRDTCERAERPDGATAAVTCAPDEGAETMTLVAYPTRAATNRAFKSALRASPVGDKDTGDCAERRKGSHAFANGKGEQGMVLCFRRGSAESVLVWTDPAQTVLGRAERTDDKDNTMYVWWAALVDRPDADTYPTSAEQGLLDDLPDAIPPTCQRADVAGNAVVAVWCQPKGGPSETYYTRFADQAALDARYAAIREAAGVAVDAGTEEGCPSENGFVYSATNATGGRRLCYFEGTTARLTYTENSTLVLVEDINSNGNAAALFAWFHSGEGTP